MPSIYRIIRKIFTRHLLAHLFIPLLVGLIVEGLLEYKAGNFKGIAQLFYDKLGLLLGIVIAYLLVAFIYLYKETRTQTERSQLAALDESLKTAESFFATCTLSLPEFFDPSTLLYFSRLLKEKMDKPSFKQYRVWIFFSEGDLTDAVTHSIFKHYTGVLARIHKYFEIDLAYLPPSDIKKIVRSLEVSEKLLLNYYPWWIKWTPEWVLKRYHRRKVPELDFALIKQTDNKKVVIPFSKYGKSLSVSNYQQETINVYEKLESLISEKIYADPIAKTGIKPGYALRDKLEAFGD